MQGTERQQHREIITSIYGTAGGGTRLFESVVLIEFSFTQ